jgi:hypothetical protein
MTDLDLSGSSSAPSDHQPSSSLDWFQAVTLSDHARVQLISEYLKGQEVTVNDEQLQLATFAALASRLEQAANWMREKTNRSVGDPIFLVSSALVHAHKNQRSPSTTQLPGSWLSDQVPLTREDEAWRLQREIRDDDSLQSALLKLLCLPRPASSIASIVDRRWKIICKAYGKEFRSSIEAFVKAGVRMTMSDAAKSEFMGRLVEFPALLSSPLKDAANAEGSILGVSVNTFAGPSGGGKTVAMIVHSSSPVAVSINHGSRSLFFDAKSDIFSDMTGKKAIVKNQDQQQQNQDQQQQNSSSMFGQSLQQTPQEQQQNQQQKKNENSIAYSEIQRLNNLWVEDDSRGANKLDRDFLCAVALVDAICHVLSIRPLKKNGTSLSAKKDLSESLDECFDLNAIWTSLNFGDDENCNRFEKRLFLLVDEIGCVPVFLRGLCSCWRSGLRTFIARMLRVDEANLLLIAAGTGGEQALTDAASSSSDNYNLLKVDPCQMFAHSLDVLARDDSHPSRNFCQALQCLLFDRDPIDANQPNSLRKWRPRLLLNASTNRFVQLVVNNARCAALALQIISSFFVSSDASTFLRMKWPDVIASLLPAWSLHITCRFARLNGLKGLSAVQRSDAIGSALRIVMSHQSNVDEDSIRDLRVEFGLLEDTAFWVNSSEYKSNLHEHIAEDKAVSKTFVCFKSAPRYRISDAFVAMFLLNYSGGLAASAGLPCLGVGDLFERAVHEHHLVCVLLNFNGNLTRQQKDALPPLSKLFADISLSGAHQVMTAQLSTDFKLCDYGMNDRKSRVIAEAAKWKTIVQGGGVVSLVNAPCAAFADLIVLSPGCLFLTQCKYVANGTRVNEQEEFLKMRGLTKQEIKAKVQRSSANHDNQQTLEILIDCCRTASTGNTVKLFSSIVRPHWGTAPKPVVSKSSGQFEFTAPMRRERGEESSPTSRPTNSADAAKGKAPAAKNGTPAAKKATTAAATTTTTTTVPFTEQIFYVSFESVISDLYPVMSAPFVAPQDENDGCPCPQYQIFSANGHVKK